MENYMNKKIEIMLYYVDIYLNSCLKGYAT